MSTRTSKKEVTDRIATAGYLAIAPALFDRVGPSITLNMMMKVFQKGGNLKMRQIQSEFDVKAALEHVRSAGNVAAIGFCWGGSLAWRVKLMKQVASRCISYYVVSFHLSHHECGLSFQGLFLAFMMDQSRRGARAFASAQPMVDTYFYDAGHGFNCDHRSQP